jgi:hypothetical protein
MGETILEMSALFTASVIVVLCGKILLTSKDRDGVHRSRLSFLMILATGIFTILAYLLGIMKL